MLDLRDLSRKATEEDLAAVRRGAKAIAEKADFSGDAEEVVLTGPPRRSKAAGAMVVSFRRPSGETDSVLVPIPRNSPAGASEEDVTQMAERAAAAAAAGTPGRALSSIARGFASNMTANGFSDRQIRRVMAELEKTRKSPGS